MHFSVTITYESLGHLSAKFPYLSQKEGIFKLPKPYETSICFTWEHLEHYTYTSLLLMYGLEAFDFFFSYKYIYIRRDCIFI